MKTKYIVLCKASREHFTFEDTKALMNFLDPADQDLHPEDYHEDLQIFEVRHELTPVPRDKEPRVRVASWLLRELK